MTTMTDHAQPQVIESPEWVPMPVPTCSIGDHEFVRTAGHAGRLLPAVIHDALVDFDPPVADHVLELLRDAGVTALAVTRPRPSTTNQNTVATWSRTWYRCRPTPTGR